MRKILAALGIAGLILITGSQAHALIYTPVAYEYNNYNWGRNYGYPTGSPVVLGGVPFNIPAPENFNTWDSNTGSGARWIDIPMNIFGASEVHTLINNSWGYWWEEHTSLTFTGSSGATYTKWLQNGSDIRDWYDGGYANGINGTTTVNVYYSGRSRVDKQAIGLPGDFADEYLVNMRMYDNGGPGHHRAFIYGLTVGHEGEPIVPEPSTLLLLGMSLMGTGFFKRKKKA